MAEAPISSPAPNDAAAGQPPVDAQIDEVLAEFGGDPRAAIAALLQDLATLAGDFEGSVSRGYVRRSVSAARLRRRAR